MKKRILSAVLALVMCLSLLPAQALAATEKKAPGEVSTWAELQAALNSGGSITLVADIICPEDGTALSAPFNKFITLDLNGYTIDRDLDEAKDNGYVITNESYLTIKDSSPLQTGKITGGSNTGNGGGIYNGQYGTITLEGGSICGNSAQNGGGIYCNSFISAQNGTAVKINGGTICHNTVTQNGGGMYCEINHTTYPKAVVINGGTICDNTAMGDGGGIWTGGHTTVCGGVIRNNIAYGNGGGLFSNFTSTKTTLDIKLTAEAGKAINITGNQAGQGGGVYLSNNVAIHVSGKVIAQDNTDSTGTIPSNVYLHEEIRMHLMEAGLAQDAKIFVSSYQNGVFLLKPSGGAATMADYPQIQRETVASYAFPVVYYGTNIWGSETGNPIAWFVLPESNYLDGNARFLWSEGAVGSKSFDTVSAADANKIGASDVIGSQIWSSIIGAIGTADAQYTWWNSQARQWLNGTFYNTAFSAGEKQGLLKTFRATGNMVMEYEGTGIDDHVFLLSAEELISPQYGFKDNLRSLGYYTDSDPAKVAGGEYLMRTPYSMGPGYSNAVPGVISMSGTFYEGGIDAAIGLEFNLRPGINLDQDTTLLLPATNSNKNTIGTTLTKFTNSEGTFKLAMQTSEMAGFRVTDQSCSGNSVTFTYTGAKTGTNHYITAAVVNENDNVSALVNLMEATSEGGTLTVNLGDVTIRDSDRLLVFCSQENGDKKTNFVSEWVQLSTTQSSSHVHSMRALQKSTSCTAMGISQDCWYCDGCKKFFADDAGVTELQNVTVTPIGHQWTEADCDTGVGCTACGLVLSGALGHEMGNTYLAENADAQKHYLACVRCKEKDEGADHTPGAAATATQPQTCTVCGYVLVEATGFTVKFDLNGHGEAIADQSVASGEKVSKPADPTVSGYIFGGWYKDAACITVWDFGNDTVSEATTLYAKWTEKKAVSITETAQTYNYDGAAKSFVISGTPSGGYTVKYYVGNDWVSSAPSDAGKYDVSISRAEDETYKAYEKTISEGLVINAGTSVVTNAPTANTLTYTGEAQALVTTGTAENGTMQYQLNEGEWSTEIPTATNAGTYTVYYKSVGNTNYSDSAVGSVEVTIDKADMTGITVDKYSGTYDGAEHGITVNNVPDGATVTYSVDGENYTFDNRFTDATNGAQTVYYKVSKENYNDFTGSATVVIAKATPNVTTWPTVNGIVYVNGNAALNSDGVVANSITGTFELAQDSWTTSGEQTVAITFKPTDSTNYNDVVKADYTVTIVKRQVVSVAVLTAITDKIYGTAQNELGLPATMTITTADGKTFENVPVVWTGYSATNLSAQTLIGTLVLTAIEAEVEQPAAAITASVVVDLQERTPGAYDYQAKTETYTGSPVSHEIPNDLDGVVSISYSYEGIDGTVYAASATAPVNAGTYRVTATFTMEDGYSSVAPKTAGLTIAKGTAPTVSIPAQQHICTVATTGNEINIASYLPADRGETAYSAPSVTGAFFKDGTAISENGVLTYGTDVIDGAADGSIELTVTMDNYEDVTVVAPVKLTAKAIVTVTVPTAQNGTYTGQSHVGYTGQPSVADYAGTFEITYTGRNGTVYETTDVAPINAGDYTVTFAIPDSDLYMTGSGSVDFTIRKATVTITAENKSAYRGSNVPELTYKVEGLVDGEELTGVPTLTTDAVMTTNGTYTITASGADAGNNYEIEYVDGTLTVRTPYVPSTPSTPSKTEATVPISGDEETIHVDASVMGDTATIDEVDLEHLDTVIGDNVQTGTVTIDFSGLDSSKPITTVEIPAGVVKEVAEAVADPTNDAESLEIILSDGTSIEFDAEALGEKASQADGLDITISIEPHEDVKITNAQKNAVGDRPAYDINVTSGGKHISDMGGKITVHAPYELARDEDPDSIVVFYVDEHGNKERCETSYDPIKQRVNWKTDHLSLYMIDYCPSAVFTDLDIGAWYHEATDYALTNGLMGGYGNGYFGPNDALSRGMLVQILYNLEGKPAVSGEMPFTDVAEGKYYVDAIMWAQQNNIVGGYGNGLFGPDDSITREQLAAMLWRYAKYKGCDVSVGEDTNILSYEDAFDISEYAIPAMQWACGAGVMGGYGNGYLGPNDGATRAQTAQMLKNFMEKAAK